MVDASWLRRPHPLHLVALIAALLLCPTGANANEKPPPPAAASWSMPLEGARVTDPFVTPAHEYAPGHRGIDLRSEHRTVRAPSDGVIVFVGAVAGRGVLTIQHTGGYLTTLEPLAASVSRGDRVTRGDPLGEVAIGGHADPGELHFGVRVDGDYVNPLSLLGGVPRAILLPCC